MSTRIHPLSVYASLASANHVISNISDSVIKPIRDSISAFGADSVLQGAAFNSLRSHMDGEISQGLLTRVEAAVEALVAANEQHQTALGIITQYAVIDLDQLRQDEIRIRENIAFVANNTFSGAEDWVAMLSEELRVLMQKREDFYRYLSSVNGIYDGLFTGLGDLASRMNLAIFCPDNGTVTIPSVAEMYFRQLMILDEEGNPILDADGNFIFDWEAIEEWMSRPYSELNPYQLDALAGVYAHLLIIGDYSGAERFINAMGRPLDVTAENPIVDLNYWYICPGLAGSILGALNNKIYHWLAVEIASEEPFRSAIQAERLQMMQGAGLLYMLTADSPLSSWANVCSGGHVDGFVFVGDANGARLVLIRDENSGDLHLSFTPIPKVLERSQARPWDASWHNRKGDYYNVRISSQPKHTITFPSINPCPWAGGRELVALSSDYELAVRTPNNSFEFTKDLTSFGIGFIPWVGKVMKGVELLFAPGELERNMNAIHESVESLRELKYDFIDIGFFDLNVILIHDQNYNFTYILMPSTETVNWP